MNAIELEDEAKFKLHFVINFLSSWCAVNYDKVCSSAQQERLEKPPVEDAKMLADAAWKHYVEILL